MSGDKLDVDKFTEKMKRWYPDVSDAEPKIKECAAKGSVIKIVYKIK